jgi:hypothetical protein
MILPSKALTLFDMMIGVAILAFSFAFLWKIFAGAMVVVVLGVYAAKGLRWPVITDRPGVWRWLPWVVWFSMLLVCPVAIGVVEGHFPYSEHPHGSQVRLRAGKLVEAFGYTHLGLSTLAAVAVVVLTRGYYRWLAWAAILLVGVFTLKLVAEVYSSIVG